MARTQYRRSGAVSYLTGGPPNKGNTVIIYCCFRVTSPPPYKSALPDRNATPSSVHYSHHRPLPAHMHALTSAHSQHLGICRAPFPRSLPSQEPPSAVRLDYRCRSPHILCKFPCSFVFLIEESPSHHPGQFPSDVHVPIKQTTSSVTLLFLPPHPLTMVIRIAGSNGGRSRDSQGKL